MTDAPDAVLDACGDMCGTLTPSIFARIRQLVPGQVLEVIADDPASRSGVPAWCRLTGHELVSLERLDAERTRFRIRRV